MLRLFAENFGPLQSVAIEQSPLMVFAGAHGTGKSYAAKLFFAMHEAFLGLPRIPFLEGALYRLHSDLHTGKHTESAFHELMDTLDTEGSCALSAIPSAHEYIQSQLSEPLIHDEIVNMFDVAKPNALCHWDTMDDLRVAMEYSECQRLVWSINYGVPRLGTPLFHKYVSGDVRVGIEQMRSRVEWLSKGDLFGNTRYAQGFFLPDSRIGLFQSYKLILSETIQMFTRGSKRQSYITTSAASFLNALVMCRPADRFPKQVAALQELLGGDVLLQAAFSGGIPSFYFRPVDEEVSLNFHQTSSFVTSLSPLLLIVRGGLRAGDMLVIEDVDMHLDPDQLATLCQILLRLSETGVNVIMTAGDPHAFAACGDGLALWEFRDGGAVDITDAF